MELRELEEKILNKNNTNKTKRNQLIQNVLDLNINSGKLDGNINFILYSEDSNEEKREKIRESEEVLKNIFENVVNIANSLEISLEKIYSK